jgi:hypothetical protein
LLQSKDSFTGQIVYSISSPGTPPILCDGSATVAGTVSGQTVNLTAVAGSQTFALNGTLSANGSTMSGTYTTVATPTCGTAQSGLQWSATLIPAITGAVQGNIHSTGPQVSPVNGQDFQVSGSLAQGPNTGASSASVTGTLNFEGYPCLVMASVNGTISGSSVILQIIAPNGLNAGQIGGSPSLSSQEGLVTVQSSAAGGNMLQGSGGYGVSTSSCPGNASSAGDLGNICLGVGGNSAACKQVLSLTPASLTFPGQPVGSPATSQSIQIANTGSVSLNGLSLSFPPTASDFNLVANYTEQDNCSSTPGSMFSLAPQQSCAATIFFSPQQSCPWLPSSAAPSHCPPFQSVRSVQLATPPALTATLTVACPNCPTITSDTNSNFNIPIAGLGISAIQPSTPELDFGAEDATLNETSPPQSVTFTNQSKSSVQILPAMTTPPCGSPGSQVTLVRPAIPGSAPGIQVVEGPGQTAPVLTSPAPSITYACDIDATSQKPNFQIVADGCSGTLLTPEQSCIVTIIYAPQPNEATGGLDDFLQLNTLECTSMTTTDCEIDSGRFPVELKSPVALLGSGVVNPLRLSPGAGLDFGTWPSGQTSYPPLTVTLSNDNKVPNPQPMSIQAITTKGDYTEIDNCGISLASGTTCTMTIAFAPKITGFDPGSVTVTFTVNPQTVNQQQVVQVISLRGFGQ